MSDLDRYWPTLLEFEGGLVDHPKDPGGLTKYGISKRAYPDLDIRKLTEDEAKALYHRDYWLPTGCETLSWPLNALAFDFAVHSGVARATRYLAMTHNPKIYLDLRELFLRRRVDERPALQVFKKGWLNRVAKLGDLLVGR